MRGRRPRIIVLALMTATALAGCGAAPTGGAATTEAPSSVASTSVPQVDVTDASTTTTTTATPTTTEPTPTTQPGGTERTVIADDVITRRGPGRSEPAGDRRLHAGEVIRIDCQGEGEIIGGVANSDSGNPVWFRSTEGWWASATFFDYRADTERVPRSFGLPWDHDLPFCDAVPGSAGVPTTVADEGAPPPDVADLIQQWIGLERTCRGETGPASDAACERRQQVRLALDGLGWCYGKTTDASLAEATWHRCGPNSEHP